MLVTLTFLTGVLFFSAYTGKAMVQTMTLSMRVSIRMSHPLGPLYFLSMSYMTTPVVPSFLSHCEIAFVAEAVVKLQT